MKLVMVACLFLACGGMQARPVFEVLLDDKATRTYDVIERATGKPTGEQVALSVRSVDKRGAYTLIDVMATENGNNQFSGMQLLIGPNGVREVFVINPDNNDEQHLRDAYENKYVPRVYLPATLTNLHLPRAAHYVDDRAYDVTGDFTKQNSHTWRMAWKGDCMKLPSSAGVFSL